LGGYMNARLSFRAPTVSLPLERLFLDLVCAFLPLTGMHTISLFPANQFSVIAILLAGDQLSELSFLLSHPIIAGCAYNQTPWVSGFFLRREIYLKHTFVMYFFWTKLVSLFLMPFRFCHCPTPLKGKGSG